MIDVHDLKAIGDAAEAINGWWSRQSGELLYRLIKELPDVKHHAFVEIARSPDVVEIGAWCGRSTVWIAAALEARGDGGVCFSVDTWKGTPGEHNKYLAEMFGPDYDLLELPLRKVWNENLERLGLDESAIPITAGAPVDADLGIDDIDVLVIDGDHSYEAVKKDFETWGPHVVPGGYLIFDDVPTWPGPTRLHNEIRLGYGLAEACPWKFIAYWDNQAVFRRLEG